MAPLSATARTRSTTVSLGQDRLHCLNSAPIGIHAKLLAFRTIPSASVDIVLNARSFSEMPIEVIQEYMAQIDRICRRYLYHDNANFKSHQLEIPAFQFPIPASFRLLTKGKSLWYGSVNNRFVEHLYEKMTSSGQGV